MQVWVQGRWNLPVGRETGVRGGSGGVGDSVLVEKNRCAVEMYYKLRKTAKDSVYDDDRCWGRLNEGIFGQVMKGKVCEEHMWIGNKYERRMRWKE